MTYEWHCPGCDHVRSISEQVQPLARRAIRRGDVPKSCCPNWLTCPADDADSMRLRAVTPSDLEAARGSE